MAKKDSNILIYVLIAIVAMILIKNYTDSFAMTGQPAGGQNLSPGSPVQPTPDQDQNDGIACVTNEDCQAGFFCEALICRRDCAPTCESALFNDYHNDWNSYSMPTEAGCDAPELWVDGCCCETPDSRCDFTTCQGWDFGKATSMFTNQQQCLDYADDYCIDNQLRQGASLADLVMNSCCCFNC